ncbi:RING-H2 finger protein ATL67-like [Impatiens glandulifera]|uniref:RING-H2 finger protein ATL67-like n=1 Tax=Impatiens glandulifera TaxID=253017 RepID=UPI001FB09DED|nr:RING-H2 finger protein ATL67-like [Impatiens glandulifera]
MSSSSSTTTHPPPPFGNDGYTTTVVLNLGLGYSIAIAVAFLILLSAVILASYICYRTQNNNSRSSEITIINHRRLPSASAAADNGIIVPRIVFVADGDDINNERNSFVGLGPAIINSYPKFIYKDRMSNKNIDSTCSICLCEYKDSEMVRMLPDCQHCFHLNCVDVWLKLNGSCPVCRSSPLPTPMSTPLSEVVPLSQYAGGRRNF